jgi:predicted glycoside hydrolase/deacetylase ChbG (UPF0249 family)
VPKYLIVNADDLGISVSTNLAIGRAHAEGLATSASLLANMPAARHAVQRVVRPHPRLGIGVHLCLTSGRPVLDPGEVPLLVGPDGWFRHGFLGLLRLVCGGRRGEALAQIERELMAQVERVEALGVGIDHVDGHQHVQMIPAIFPLALRLARERRAVLRLADEPLGAPKRWPARLARSLATGGLLKWLVLSRMARAIRRRVPLSAAVHYFGVLQAGRMTLGALRAVVQSLPEGVSEINVHPGSPAWLDESLEASPADRRFLRRPERAAELNALLAPALRTELQEARVRLVRFSDVLDSCDFSRSAARSGSQTA